LCSDVVRNQRSQWRVYLSKILTTGRELPCSSKKPRAARVHLHHDQPFANLASSRVSLLLLSPSGGFISTIASSSSFKSKIKFKQKHALDGQVFFDSPGVARKALEYRRSDVIDSQGDPTKGVKYIRKGRVKLTVANEVGKEAVLAILGPGDFFGEGCLAGQPICMATATAIVPTSILFIEKQR
jgi:CRP-like cAMP-binding protein